MSLVATSDIIPCRLYFSNHIYICILYHLSILSGRRVQSITPWLLMPWRRKESWYWPSFSTYYIDVIMNAMASQITGVSIVYSTICSGAVERRHQSSASLAFVRGIHRWPVNYPLKGPVTRKCFHLMTLSLYSGLSWVKMVYWSAYGNIIYFIFGSVNDIRSYEYKLNWKNYDTSVICLWLPGTMTTVKVKNNHYSLHTPIIKSPTLFFI